MAGFPLSLRIRNFACMKIHDGYMPKLPKLTEQIIFEDDNLIVINKPPFLASLDEREGGEPSVLRLARKYHRDAQVCHRLDKETSGLLHNPRNPETNCLLYIEFERSRVNKIYHAIIE